MNSSAKRVIGKLSVWGVIMAFLLWLGKQLLAYLWALIQPWLTWLFSWLMIIAGVAILVGILVGGLFAYFAFRSWKRRREEKKESNEKKA